MLVTILNQIYILLTCLTAGSFVLRRIYGREPGPGSSIVCGIAVLTAYAGYFSLFAGVGAAANILLILICIIFVFIDRKIYLKMLSTLFKGRSRSRDEGTEHGRTAAYVRYAAAAAIILISAYFTASGRFSYDTGTYHAQSIHWIESLGVVKGLAYMQTRLGFNSSYFCLSALFSMHFLGQSLHSLSGFLASFVMIYSLNGLLSGRRLRVSSFMYLSSFAYFAVTAVEIISPSTDHGVIWLILWLCIRWVELIETKDERSVKDTEKGYALLSVMAVFLISIKLSVGVLALLVIRPAYGLIKNRRWKEAAGYIAAGIILILPYFIRNYYITGWLVYPFPAADLFSPDWKIPAEGVRYEADEIVVWARYTKDVALIDQSIREWFPIWWREQGAANRYLSVSAFVGVIAIAVRFMVYLVRLILHTADREEGEYAGFGMILSVCFIFFMIAAPSNRFGYAYILLLPLFAAGDIAVNGRSVFLIRAGAAILICAGMLRGVYMFASDDFHYAIDEGAAGYAVCQKDYPEADSDFREWEGIRIFYPLTEGGQIWYHDFPAILYEGNLEGIERRGDSLKDGFRLK